MASDPTVEFFNNFYSNPAPVNANEYDVVLSYFKQTSQSDTVARNFTDFLFKVSVASGQSAMDLLDYVKGSDKIQVNILFAYYLNSLKSKTALYGMSSTPAPNRNVQRNIVV